MPVQRKRRIVRWILVGIVTVFILIQFIPVERPESGPVNNEPSWNSEKTRQYAVRACYDCHSNQTNWPAYSYVAPVSWLVAGHVRDAKKELNFSEWKYSSKMAREIIEEISEGKMPLDSYLLMHPGARFSVAEKQEFITGLRKTFNIPEENSSASK